MLILFGAPLLAEMRRFSILLNFAWRVSMLYVKFALKVAWLVLGLVARVVALLPKLLRLLLLAMALAPLLLAESIQKKR